MKHLHLDIVAATLEGLEETIIFKLVDRVQYCANQVAYEKGRSGFEGEPQESLLALRIRRQEEMDAQFGRFEVPEERPFTAHLPKARRAAKLPETGLAIGDYEAVNVTHDILESYIGLVPRMCGAGDDGHYGSSVEHDVYALQAISRRIHYGALFVGESKYRSNPHRCRELVAAADKEGLLAMLTRRKVEDAVIERVRDKVEFVQARSNMNVRKRIEAEIVVQYYRDHVIPLTKKGEVLYLLHRKTDGEQKGGRAHSFGMGKPEEPMPNPEILCGES